MESGVVKSDVSNREGAWANNNADAEINTRFENVAVTGGGGGLALVQTLLRSRHPPRPFHCRRRRIPRH